MPQIAEYAEYLANGYRHPWVDPGLPGLFSGELGCNMGAGNWQYVSEEIGHRLCKPMRRYLKTRLSGKVSALRLITSTPQH